MPLTEIDINQAKGGTRPNGTVTTKPYKIGDAGGLYLEVPPTGKKRWRLKYRFGGKEKTLAFGLYPEVSLLEARNKRDAARLMLADEIDPSEYVKAERTERLREQARKTSATRFVLDSNGALSFQLGRRQLAMTVDETIELRAFLDATKGVAPRR